MFCVAFDKIVEFCQAVRMSRTIGKFIAVTLAIWLPLFSGNALAVSVVMQSMAGDCHSALAQQSEHQPHCASTMQQPMHHAQLDEDANQSGSHHDQQNTTDDNCGTCHLACCGYLATATIDVMGAQPSVSLFTIFSTQFQSITSTPLDPPPLARV